MAGAREIKHSMVDQLKAQGRCTPHNLDMIERYLELRRLAATLKKDIATKGIRYEVTNGNGIATEKDNASVKNFSATIQTMLQLRQKMRLDDPVAKEEDGFEGYM